MEGNEKHLYSILLKQVFAKTHYPHSVELCYSQTINYQSPLVNITDINRLTLILL